MRESDRLPCARIKREGRHGHTAAFEVGCMAGAAKIISGGERETVKRDFDRLSLALEVP